LLLAVTTLLVLSAAPLRAQPIDIVDRMQQLVGELAVPGAVVVVRGSDEAGWYAAGSADLHSRAPFVPHMHLRFASLTKTFVAATVLQLVAERRIDLDAPVQRYLPGRLRGNGIDGAMISVRQLLRHQSGLPEYLDADEQMPETPQTADQLLDRALIKTAQFPPGTAVRYTNTNYVAAGMIIESVTAATVADEIARRILVPLGLTGTYFPAPGDTGLRLPYAHGYRKVSGEFVDATALNASVAGMAGSIISTAEDIATFYEALIDGGLLPVDQLAEMTDTVDGLAAWPGAHYGLGLAAIDLPCGRVWGHPGGGEGYTSLALKQPGGPTLVVVINASVGAAPDGADPRMQLARDVFCH
jgi:D-alanyl-D-alanine carboxypeptidase